MDSKVVSLKRLDVSPAERESLKDYGSAFARYEVTFSNIARSHHRQSHFPQLKYTQYETSNTITRIYTGVTTSKQEIIILNSDEGGKWVQSAPQRMAGSSFYVTRKNTIVEKYMLRIGLEECTLTGCFTDDAEEKKLDEMARDAEAPWECMFPALFMWKLMGWEKWAVR